MKYLSIDIESTGLDQRDDLLIEFAMIPFDTDSKTLATDLAKDYIIKCPPFKELKPRLSPWVIEHNKTLIDKANREGILFDDFKRALQADLTAHRFRKYFQGSGHEKIVLFGKSLSAIDLPFLHRDLGHHFMREHFHHRTVDLTCIVYSLVDSGHLPPQTRSGQELMNFFHMGEVAHTALEDAKNTAILYAKILSTTQV